MKRLNAMRLLVLLAVVAASSLTYSTKAVLSSSIEFPVTVVDDFGRRIIIDEEPQRVVCQGPSCTEIVYALGALDKVVAVDPYSDYPPEVAGKQKIGASGLGYIKLSASAEDFKKLEPDLVLTYSYVGKDEAEGTILPQLEALGLKVIVLKPHTLEDILSNIELVGKALGRAREAATLVQGLRARVEMIKERVANITYRPKVYIESWYPPPWTFGPGTWGHQLIEMAGGVNAFGDAQAQWVRTSDEEIIERDPDVIVSLWGAMHRATLEDFKARPGWGQVRAVQRGAVYVVDENLFLRPGPRLVEGLEVLAGILHPEIFGSVEVVAADIDISAVNKGLAPTLSGTAESFNFTLLVTKAAAPSNFTLKATVIKVGPSPPQGLKVVGDYLNVYASVSGVALRMLAVISYDEAEVGKLGVNEETLAVYRWDGEEWVEVPSAVMADEDLVVAAISHTSYLALMGSPGAPPPPLMSTPIPLWQALMIGVAAAAALGLVGFALGRGRRR